jgi:hypothetical protein
MAPLSDAERSRNYRERKAALSLSAQYAAANIAKLCSAHLRAFATKGYIAETVHEMYGNDHVVKALITRAASSPATLAGASSIAGLAFPDALIGLCPQSAFVQLREARSADRPRRSRPSYDPPSSGVCDGRRKLGE